MDVETFACERATQPKHERVRALCSGAGCFTPPPTCFKTKETTQVCDWGTPQALA